MRLGCVGGTLRDAVTEQPGRDSFELMLDEAGRLGLVSLCWQPDHWQVPDHVEHLAIKARSLGITLEPTWSDPLADPNPAVLRPPEAFATWLDGLCVPFGCPIVGLVVRGGSRFRHEPPLDEQLALIIERARPLADVAAARGICLAIENHADYRAAEILQIVQGVNQPHFGVRLDTGNPLTIGEDPVDAARILAPWTLTTHLKDMYMYPVGRHDRPEGPRMPHQTGAPLGQGVVCLPKIINLLHAHAPDPANLPLNIEIDWRPPEEDARQWLVASIRYCREAFEVHLTAGGPPDSGKES